MGFFDWFKEDVLDDALGFVSIPDPPKPAAQPAIATTDPATNTPTPTPAQTSFDQVKSYLNAQAQRAFMLKLKQSSKSPEFGPPTFSQTEQGQKLIKLGIVAALAWLFLFSKNG